MYGTASAFLFVLITCGCSLLTIVYIIHLQDLGAMKPGIRSKFIASEYNKTAHTSKRYTILIYTHLFGSREWYHLPEKEAKNFASSCECSNCEVTYDNARLNESDAVVFHGRDIGSPSFLKQYTTTSRPYYQRWAYFTSENPFNTPDRRPLDGLFNWTMTYRKESDIWLPYKKYHQLKSSEDKLPYVNYAAEKNKVPNRKLAFWVSTNCHTYRNQYVHKLQDLISLDVAGGCARQFKNPIHNCNEGGRDECMKKIRNYKFYLAFENAFCDQYVTEKYWYNAVAHDSVPVVLGGGPYNDAYVAIPGSFINAEDFPTVKALADYLLYLDKNDTAYNEYFKWKSKYGLDSDIGWPFPDIFVCEICRKLQTDHNTKVYEHLSDFWSYNHCKKIEDTKVSQILKRS